MTTTVSTVRPLRRQELVACEPAAALSLWTEQLGTWWPLSAFSVFGEGATAAFVGDDIVETSPGGETATWGTVTERTDESIAFTWHPGSSPERASHVSVAFSPAGADLALVTLEHTGWETYDDPEAARARYADGWMTVLDRFTAARPGSAADIWLVLSHTAGPATPPAGVFSSPDFAHHVAFLTSLREAGVLVAGGPLPDERGAGMTIVRAGDLAAAREAIARAQLEDGAVRSGLLDVRVRPWRVAMSGV